MQKKNNELPRAFIIMPIATPRESLSIYQNDSEHFTHVLEHIFVPALEKAGFLPILPVAKGSDIIHAEIISNLELSNLVLCDMTGLNPNVFFEFGIRTALDRSVCLVVDDNTETIPFDTQIINYHTYNSDIRPWIVKSEIEKLVIHIQSTIERTPDYNALWKVFGLKTKGKSSTDIETSQEIKFLQMQNKMLSMQLETMAKKSELPSKVSVQNKPIHRCSNCGYGFVVDSPNGLMHSIRYDNLGVLANPSAQIGIYPSRVPEKKGVRCPNCGNWDSV